MEGIGEGTVWALVFTGLWVFLSVTFHVDSRQELRVERPPSEQGNAIVVLAHTGYHTAAVGTVLVASLSPLGEILTGALRTVPGRPPAALVDAAVLGSYSLLAFVGVVAVYLGVRSPFLRTTEKCPPLCDSLLSLVQATGSHFLPAYLLVLLTTVGHRPLLSGLLAALALVIWVPLAGAVHDRFLLQYRAPTAAEREIVTAGPLPEDVPVRVGRAEYDSHQVVVNRLGFERPMVFLGSDVREDLSDECISAMLRVANRKAGLRYTLAARTPKALFFGATTAALIHFGAGFHASIGVFVVAYYVYALTVAPAVQHRLLSVRPDLPAERLRAMLAELRDTQRVPLAGYIEPISVTVDGFARELIVERGDRKQPDERADDAPGG